MIPGRVWLALSVLMALFALLAQCHRAQAGPPDDAPTTQPLLYGPRPIYGQPYGPPAPQYLDSLEADWRGLVILDGQALRLDPEFAATFWSVEACESGGKDSQVGAAGERGRLQIHPIHISRIITMGYSWDDMFRTEPNLLVAQALWQEQGWSPWSCQPAYRTDVWHD